MSTQAPLLDSASSARPADATELMRRISTPLRERLARFGRNKSTEVLAGLDTAIQSLTPAELAALVSGDPSFGFAKAFYLAATPDDAWIDATIRWRALNQLSELDPAQALALTEKAEVKDTSAELINLITGSLQRWAADDPMAALRWGKTHAERLPLGINHAHMALEALAREDMAGAWETARREGFDVTQAMAYLSRATKSREDCDAFMAEIAKLQAAAPNGFVGGANQWYGDLAVKLANSRGFDEAKSFVEKWASDLAWRDSIALEVAKTALTRTADPQSAAAADWLVNFAPEARRAKAVQNLVGAWADEDFTQAAKWLQNHTAEPWHDAGVAALCKKVAPFDQAAAAEWAASIKDPSPPRLSPQARAVTPR